MTTALVILANGFEEIEAVTQIDVLRRAEIEVTAAGLEDKIAEGAHGIKIPCDILLEELDFEPNAVVLPGGMPGSETLGKSDKVVELLQKQARADRLIAAICAAPAFAPVRAGVLDGKTATCYPSFEKRFGGFTKFSEDRVVIDGNVITSRSPGTALEMALAIVTKLLSAEKAAELAQGMLVKP